MKNLKSLVTRLPEYYLIIFVLLSGYSPPLTVHPIAIGLIVILILQIVFKNSISGVVIASLFMLVNLYMLLALISEFSEFETLNSAALQLLFGVFLFALNSTACFLMIRRYTQNELQVKQERRELS